MKTITLEFSKESNTHSFAINKENPYYLLYKITIPALEQKTLKSSKAAIEDINFILKRKKREGLNPQENLVLANIVKTPSSLSQGYQLKEFLSQNSDYDEIELILEDKTGADVTVQLLIYNTKHLVAIGNPWNDFHAHISDTENAQILFSAPFGQGKTTFLNSYFDQFKHTYLTFKIYPVNYSISSNEDIFKYIKAELLFQLMAYGAEFKRETFNHIETSVVFFKNNIEELISPFIALLPHIGKSASEIYKEINKFRKEYLKFHYEMNINEEEEALKFIRKLYDQEGSIFEDNFYSQLIRSLVEQLHIYKNKETVLIIDDLDRMDPDHVFRILNVLSAHYDSPEYGYGSSNKFGFDKIIVCCDYENLARIFAHRYGPNTHFDGYINKYFSKEVFFYDNKSSMKFLIEEIANFHQGKSDVLKTLVIVLEDLLETENITLRELLKWHKTWLNDKKEDLRKNIQFVSGGFRMVNSQKYAQFLPFYIINLMLCFGSPQTLKNKFLNCRSSIRNNHHSRKNIPINEIAGPMFPPLIQDERVNDKREYTFPFKNSMASVYFKTNEDGIGYTYLTTITLEQNGNRVILDLKDLYELLALNVDKFVELNGLKDHN
ncbi:MAG TPA: P-loop NTPase fold protein [Flavobacteriales bacterium]|nr:P-loop NTPase fold protein [Flavobacteriales bacterium]